MNMNDIFLYALVAVVFIILGYIIGKLFTKNSYEKVISELETRNELLVKDSESNDNIISKLNIEKNELYEEKHAIDLQLFQKISELKYLEEKLQENKTEVEKLQQKFTKDFEILANKILEDKSSKFTEKNKENLKNILEPLQQKIQVFEKKVEDTNDQNIRRAAAFKQQLEELNKNNLKISQEAVNLTKALKGDSKTQGNWGELILEHVLEKSGLVKDREYFVQQSFTNEEDKRVFPDVIISLPDGKKMIVDSKVSLTAYEKYTNTEDKETQNRYLKEHISSIKRHITELSAKEYQNLYKIESPDFILMFIPIEPALYIAQNEDNNFFYTAFNKNILLVSPTTLLSTLRTIDALWKNEKQHQNVIDIAKHATSLYNKFKNLLDDLELIGNRLKSTNNAYQGAMKKLTGNQNLIKDIDKLEKLGVSPKEKISQKWIERSEEDESQ
jgi:DNA recombination protein RmuC